VGAVRLPTVGPGLGRRLPGVRVTWAQNIYKGLTAANLAAFLYLWGANTTAMTGPNTGLVEVKGQTVATLVDCGRSRATAGSSAQARSASRRRRATQASR
jgi:hypothetical protein